MYLMIADCRPLRDVLRESMSKFIQRIQQPVPETENFNPVLNNPVQCSILSYHETPVGISGNKEIAEFSLDFLSGRERITHLNIYGVMSFPGDKIYFFVFGRSSCMYGVPLQPVPELLHGQPP